MDPLTIVTKSNCPMCQLDNPIRQIFLTLRNGFLIHSAHSADHLHRFLMLPCDRELL